MKSLLSLWIFDWRKVLAYTHRWLGIAGCILFVAWFISGIVMMYARMPGLADEERLARAPALDLSTLTLSPVDAAAKAGVEADRVQVGMLGSRRVYRFGARNQTVVFADTGTSFEGMVDKEQALEVARRYAPGHAGPIRYAEYLTEPNQQIVCARPCATPRLRVLLAGSIRTTAEHIHHGEADTRPSRFWSAPVSPVWIWKTGT